MQKKGKSESSRCHGKGCKKHQLPKTARKITKEDKDPPNTGPHIPLEEANAVAIIL